MSRLKLTFAALATTALTACGEYHPADMNRDGLVTAAEFITHEMNTGHIKTIEALQDASPLPSDMMSEEWICAEGVPQVVCDALKP